MMPRPVQALPSARADGETAWEWPRATSKAVKTNAHAARAPPRRMPFVCRGRKAMLPLGLDGGAPVGILLVPAPDHVEVELLQAGGGLAPLGSAAGGGGAISPRRH